VSLKKPNAIILILTATLFCVSAVAQTATSTTTGQSTQTAELKTNGKTDPKIVAAKRKKLGVDQSDFMPAENRFGAILSYGLRYDDLQQTKKKTVGHVVSLAGTYSFSEKWSSYLSVSFAHDTAGGEIVKENDDDEYHAMSDLNAGVVYTLRQPLQYLAVNSTTFNLSLPVSERSQIDKNVVDATVSNYTQSKSWYRFSLFNRANVDYLWNRLKFSVYDGDTLNRDWLFANGLGFNYQILDNVGFRASLAMEMSRYLDDSWDLTFGNRLTIYSNFKGFQVFASVVNNAYPENERVDIDFYDKYKRLYSVGVVYAF